MLTVAHWQNTSVLNAGMMAESLCDLLPPTTSKDGPHPFFIATHRWQKVLLAMRHFPQSSSDAPPNPRFLQGRRSVFGGRPCSPVPGAGSAPDGCSAIIGGGAMPPGCSV